MDKPARILTYLVVSEERTLEMTESVVRIFSINEVWYVEWNGVQYFEGDENDAIEAAASLSARKRAGIAICSPLLTEEIFPRSIFRPMTQIESDT